MNPILHPLSVVEARRQDLARIDRALTEAMHAVGRFIPGAVAADRKAGGSPVTEADRLVDDLLLKLLPEDGEGWLSEETADDSTRLQCRRVWVVDPLDGTKEFVAGIPEWCISVGLVEDGVAVAGGICAPAGRQVFLGSRETGVLLNGHAVHVSRGASLEGAMVLASRSEVDRGEWERFRGGPFVVRPMGSVAYKLALVASGHADATWTLVPKHEWDVAAGVALVCAAGGVVRNLGGRLPTFNNANSRLDGLIATAPGLAGPVDALLRSFPVSG